MSGRQDETLRSSCLKFRHSRLRNDELRPMLLKGYVDEVSRRMGLSKMKRKSRGLDGVRRKLGGEKKKKRKVKLELRGKGKRLRLRIGVEGMELKDEGIWELELRVKRLRKRGQRKVER